MSVPGTTSDTPQAARSRNGYRVAIVGAATLKGKEVAEILGERNFPSLDVKLLDDDESIGQLEAAGDEVSFIQSVRAEQFDRVDFTFFASDQACTKKNWQAVQRAGSAIVDLSYALENEPSAQIRSPWVERQLGQTVRPELQPRPVVVAHPAAVVLALMVLRLQKATDLRAVNATVFEPASEHGQSGMDELHQQTVNLLSFQQLPKKVFDVQVAFNMIARYGEQASPTLASAQERIMKHYRSITADALIPSLLLVQAPIFHGFAFAVRLEFSSPADASAVTKALSGEHFTVTSSTDESPSNVNAAGQGSALVSVLPDAASTQGLWLWAAADNLRLAAINAVECAESMSASRPSGQVQ